jgi:hypothetical protein
MKKEDIKVGTKVMYFYRYGSVYYRGKDIEGITTDIITKINKETFSTEKKQLLIFYSFYGINALSFRNDEYNRKEVECDVRKRMFKPTEVLLFNEEDYNRYKKELEKRIKEKDDTDKKWENHKIRKEETFSTFKALCQKLFNEQTPILANVYVDTICVKCKHYNANGTCARDNHFYNVGKLKNTKYRFFDGDGTMCKWEER